jgi:hypothetical protein
MKSTRTGRPAACPSWCVLGHGVHLGEEDQVHVSAQLCVRNTLIRLCTSIDPGTGLQDGPYVMMGSNEYTLGEVDALVEALTALAGEARGSLAPEDPEGALPVTHP